MFLRSQACINHEFRTHTTSLLMAALALTLSVPFVWAESTKNANGLWEFHPNEVIKSAEVNENFASLNERLSVYEDTVSVKDGKVGIGTDNPDEVLHINQPNANWVSWSRALIIGGDQDIAPAIQLGYGGTGKRWGIGSNYAGRYLNFFTTTSDGYSGTYTPQLVLDSTANSTKLLINGSVQAQQYLTTSDSRLKRNIKPLEGGLSGIQCLQGVTYRWKEESASQEEQIGLIAQEVERCYPQLVSTDAKGYKSVAYDRLVAPLIEAVKFQQAQLQVLQQQNMTVMNRLVALENNAGIHPGVRR